MEITIPHRFKPREYQIPVLRAIDNGAKRLVLVWARRSGKDKVAWNIIVKKACERVGTYYYFAPTFTQGKRIIWDGRDKDGVRFLDHIPETLIARKNETELKIELKNGSIIQIIGTEKIDSIVGTNPIGCVFTEYSLMRPDVWDFIRPILAENDGWALFVFTPRGMNHGFKILQQAKQDERWFWQVLTIEDTKAISEETLRVEREQMPRDLYEQEYLCKFVEGAGQFFKNIDECVYYEPLIPDLNRRYQLGVDLAKYNDYTVITPFDLTTFRAGTGDRFNQIDYNLQKSRIELFWHKYGKAKVVMDSTGVGEPVYDDLKQKVRNLEPFHFTEQSRRDLLVNLQLLLETGKIRIPNDQILIDELRSFRYELTDRGKVRIVAPEGLHDDCVMSLALSVWNIPDRPTVVKSYSDAEDLKNFDFYRKKKGAEYFTGSRYLKR